MDDILTEQGKRLVKQGVEKGKFLSGLLLSLGLNVGCTYLFAKSITNVRSDDWIAEYGGVLLVLMVLEVVGGRALKPQAKALGTGIALGGWIAPLTPVLLIWGFSTFASGTR